MSTERPSPGTMEHGEQLVEMTEQVRGGSQLCFSQTDYSSQAMRRDGSRCVLTRVVDDEAYMQDPQRFPNDRDTAPLVLAHILPFSLNKISSESKVSILSITGRSPIPTLMQILGR